MAGYVDRSEMQVGARVNKAMRALLALAADEADSGLPPVVQTRLRRGVVGALAFLQDAVARAHVEIQKPKPNAVAVALGGKAAVALLQGTGLLQTFHVLDSRAFDTEGLSDVIIRAEALRLQLASRAAELADGPQALPGAGMGEGEEEAHGRGAGVARYDDAGARANGGG